ncbi:MAG: hypothetical protein M3Y87_31320 [Myxococcota bacterium]|nr:hypothetical protein [Myxococcota bacterium]
MSLELSRPVLLLSLVLVSTSCAFVDEGPAGPRIVLDAGARPSARDAALPRRDAGLHANAFGIVVHGTQLTMRAGASLAIVVELIRADGFDTPITIALHGLPPGVRASARTAGPNVRYLVLFLEAEDGAVTQESVPFALEATAGGWVRRARLTVSVTR